MKPRLTEKLTDELDRTAEALLACADLTDESNRSQVNQLNNLLKHFSDTLDILRPFYQDDPGQPIENPHQLLRTIFNHCQTRLDRLRHEAAAMEHGPAMIDATKTEPHQGLDHLAVTLGGPEHPLGAKLRQLSLLNKEIAGPSEQMDLTSATLSEFDEIVSRNGRVGDFKSILVVEAEDFLASCCPRTPENGLTEESHVCHRAGQCLCLGAVNEKGCLIHHCIETGQTLQARKRHVKDGGAYQDLEVSFVPVPSNGTIKHVVRVARDITEQNKKKHEIKRLAYFDSLTGLPNRALFEDRLRLALQRAQRNQQRLAVIYLDLDDFKQINDRYGHQCGDELLSATASRLSALLRKSDSVARLGGDEFVIFLPEIVEEQQIVLVLTKILRSLSTPFPLENTLAKIGGSLGVAVYPEDGDSVERLMNHADLAMYAAKREGKNKYHFFGEQLQKAIQQRAQLEVDISAASQRGDFFLQYQPQYNIQTNQIVGVEALLRWRRVDGRILPPDNFLAVADESGLIVPIGEWVLGTACKQLMFWHRKGLRHLQVSLNMSCKQLLDPGFFSQIETVLVQTKLPTEAINLEFSERCFKDGGTEVNKRLHQCKEWGLHLTLDDFGTGSCALSHLMDLPFDRLKIDRSLMAEAMTNPKNAALIESILALAQRMKVNVLAEGIESEEQLAYLSVKGCQLMQGFYFGEPMKPLEISRLLERSNV